MKGEKTKQKNKKRSEGAGEIKKKGLLLHHNKLGVPTCQKQQVVLPSNFWGAKFSPIFFAKHNKNKRQPPVFDIKRKEGLGGRAVLGERREKKKKKKKIIKKKNL